MEERAQTALIDRDPQNLPVPIGGMAPVRIRRPRLHRPLRAHLPVASLWLGAVTGAVGLALLAVPRPVAVSLSGHRLEVGRMVLTQAAPVTGSGLLRYEGDASYALAEHGDGSAAAAAAWLSAGTMSSGVCTLRPAAGERLVEECEFSVGGSRFTSVDTLDPAAGIGWQRTYSDGARTTISVPPDGAAVPVPFPIGR